jgi:hypothetical protein
VPEQHAHQRGGDVDPELAQLTDDSGVNQLAQRCQQEPVTRREPRSPDVPPQDRQLVPQHEELELLRALAACEQHDQLE